MIREHLLSAVEFAAKVITGKVSLPVLECVHLKGDGERLTVTASNLDLWARMAIASDMVIDCCVPAGRLKAKLAALPDDEIELSESGDVITMRGGNGRAVTLNILPGDQFPQPTPATGATFAIPGAAMALVIPAAQPDDVRYVMKSVYFDPKGQIVASDGHRIHFVEAETTKTPAVIPIAAAKLLAGVSGEMRCHDGKFTATGDDWEIGGKLIEGAYPNWRQMLSDCGKPKPIPEDFAAIVTRAMQCADDTAVPFVDVFPDRIEAPGFREDIETGMAKYRITPKWLLEAMKAAGSGASLAGSENDRRIIITNDNFTAAVGLQRMA